MARSNNLFEFHKAIEGVHYKPYRCPAGVLTIGIGHTNPEVYPFNEQSVWTDEEVAAAWDADIKIAYDRAEQLLDGMDIPEEFIDAVADIIFNTGQTPRTMVAKLRSGDLDGAAKAVLQWIYCGKTALPGLVKRRLSLYAYLKGHSDWLGIVTVPVSSVKEDGLDALNSRIDEAGLGYRVVRVESPAKLAIVKV